MPLTEPSQYYTGIVAELYRPLRSVVPDPEPYARFIRRSGEPALELGCGDGDPLLDLRSRGLDVEGLDSSSDMLDRCRRDALSRGLDVALHCQTMETMHIKRQFRSIFLAGPTFNLLPDDQTALRALARIRIHLAVDGSALIPLFIPPSTPTDDLGKARIHTTADGNELRFTAISEQRDEHSRTQTTLCRYELITPTEQAVEERTWLLHWYTQNGFRDLAADAGLTVSVTLTSEGTPASPDDQNFVFYLTEAHRDS
jgi:SAM-dependent methyltransferase